MIFKAISNGVTEERIAAALKLCDLLARSHRRILPTALTPSRAHGKQPAKTGSEQITGNHRAHAKLGSDQPPAREFDPLVRVQSDVPWLALREPSRALEGNHDIAISARGSLHSSRRIGGTGTADTAVTPDDRFAGFVEASFV